MSDNIAITVFTCGLSIALICWPILLVLKEYNKTIELNKMLIKSQKDLEDDLNKTR